MADDNDLEVRFGADIEGASRGIDEVKSKLHEVGEAAQEAGQESEGGLKGLVEAVSGPLESLESLKSSVKEFAELLAAGFAIEKIVELVNETAEAAEHIERMGAMLGATTTQVQQLGATASLTGGDADQMAMQMERLQLQLARVGSAASPAGQALKVLGVNAEEFRRLSPPEQIDELAEAFSRFADGPTKTAAAMALLGRAGAQMIPYLDRGKEGLAELNKTAAETGVIMSEHDVKAMAELAEQEKTLGLATKALGQDIAISLSGPLSVAVGWATKLIEALDRLQKQAAPAQSMAWQGLFGVPVLDPTGEILDKAIGGASGGRDVTVRAKPQVPQMDLGGGRGGGSLGSDDAGAKAEQDYENAMAEARRSTSSVEDALNNLQRTGQITWQQWAEGVRTASEIETQEVEQAYAKISASTALTSEEKKRIWEQEQNALEQIAKKEADAQTKAAQESQKQWESSLGTIMGVFDSALQGMLSGHETFRASMEKSLESLSTKFLKMIEDWVVKWLAGEMTRATATTAANTAIAASELATNTAGIGSMIASALRAITVDAGQAFGGVFAFLAPFMGPAAAGPAAAASASVMGAASFDIGAWNIPGDQLAMVHQNELVMPAAQAGAFRDMLTSAANGGGSGGVAIHPTTNVNVNALDGASVSSWMRSNSSGMVKAIDQAVRHGAALGARRLRSL